MTRILLSGTGAAAWGTRLALADYIPAFPITPQNEITETLATWINQGEMPGKLVTLESERAMLSAAGAAATSGVRVFAAISSQGLLSALEMLYNIADWRAPIVLANVSLGRSGQIASEADHNDALAARDTGFIQIHCATCQEILDSVLFAHRLAEDDAVRLPVLVNMDCFCLSSKHEPVDIPNATTAKQFVGSYDPGSLPFVARTPPSQAVPALGNGPYSYFRYEMHLAAEKALTVYEDLAHEFRDFFSRYYPAVDAYRCDDAEYVFVILGSFAIKAQKAIDRLRDGGWKFGLLRPRLLRPFPQEQFINLLRGKRAVAVIDQNFSLGKGGILHTELASSLYGQHDVPATLASFIGGLGGRDISTQEFFEMATELRKAADTNVVPTPRLLFTQEEFREVENLKAITQLEHHKIKQPT